MLYIFGGLPGTGKTELSRFLANSIKAVYLRIDTIEQSLRDTGFKQIYDEGYKIAFSLARENLLNGLSVVCDSTNPVQASREAFIKTAKQANAPFIEIEVICSDVNEHKHRVEQRTADITGLKLPTWQSVVMREYEMWKTADIILDTASQTPTESKIDLQQALKKFINHDQ